jgi:hypothetical protein
VNAHTRKMHSKKIEANSFESNRRKDNLIDKREKSKD